MQNRENEQKLIQFQNQVARLQRRVDRLSARSDQFTRWRMFSFIGGTSLTLLLAYSLAIELSVMIAILSVIVFSVVVMLHRRVDRRLERYQLWQKIKQDHIARTKIDWEHIPTPPQIERPDEHPFMTDLNLLDERSLHQLLDTGLSYEGSQRLADWLLNPVPEPETSLARQNFVRNTRHHYMLRDKLRVIGAASNRYGRIRAQRLQDWFTQHPVTANLRPNLIMAAGLSVINIVLFLAFMVANIPPLFILGLFLYFVVQVPHFSTVSELSNQTRSLFNSLARIQDVLKFLEKQHTPEWMAVLKPIHENPPSQELRALLRIMIATSAQQNPILGLILNLIMPYDLFFAYMLEQQKQHLSPRMQAWLESFYELEALNSLANFAFLNEAYTFATFDEKAGLQGTQLGHPMLKPQDKVCNDFSMASQQDVIIITGSNMAGKSTFLRTLGVNLVLAYTGGAVDAQALNISWFRVFTSIKVTDSINDGISYFYAEVRRLKALLRALEEDHTMPVFFMIDEIFRGTNNRERLIGSRSYIRAVAQKNGVGLIATHDLELIHLEEEFDNIRNFHFREDIRGNRMVFDYLLREGPCPTTNALRIMAIEGLPVEDGAL